MLSEEPLAGGNSIRAPIAYGLRGIRQLTHSLTTDCSGYKKRPAMSGKDAEIFQAGDTCSTVLLRGTVPRTQLPCGEIPPVQLCSPATPHLCSPAVDPLEPPANCRDVVFRTEAIEESGLNRLLFTDDGAPRVVEKGPTKGSLSFTPRPGQTGKARFRVVMEKRASDPLEGAASRQLLAANEPVVREFIIQVYPVNDPPIIRSTLDIQVDGDAGPRVEIFAPDVFAEGAGIQNYSWEWGVNNITHPPEPFPCRIENAALRTMAERARGVNCSLLNSTTDWPPVLPNRTAEMEALFRQAPTFSFQINEDGVLQGLVSFEAKDQTFGEIRLYARMHDGTAINLVTGGSPSSTQVSFLINVKKLNYKPSFVPSQTLFQLVEGQDTLTQNSFATQIKPGILAWETYQKVNFTLSHLEPINVFGWNLSNTHQIVPEFAITLDGNLTFRMATDFSGDFRMFIQIEDDADVEFGGRASTLVAINVSVDPINDRPLLKDNGAKYYVCRWTNVTYTVGLNESASLATLYSHNFDCDFKDDFCGYMNASQLNVTAVEIPWIRYDRRVVPMRSSGFPPIYYGTGPEHGQGAKNCRDLPVIADVDDICSDVDYYAAANAYEVPYKGGDYGFIQSAPLRGVASSIINVAISGGTETTSRQDMAAEVVFSFYYHMFDGEGSYEKITPFVGPMGSLELLARGDPAHNWTSVWKKTGAQTNYHEWAKANVSFTGGFLQGAGLEVQFRAERSTTNNIYSVMALDTIAVDGAIFRDDRTVRCVMEMSITGVFFDAVRTIDGAFEVVQPVDELATQVASFVLILQSGHELFFDAPTADSSGTLILPLARAGRGKALIQVVIQDNGAQGGGNENASEPFFFELTVDGFEVLPPFTLLPSLTVVDGAGLQNFSEFANVAALANLANASRDYLRFVVKCASTAPGMFAHYPSIDPLGTLTLEVATGFSGQSYCSVQMGSNDASVSLSLAQYFTLKVLTRPQVLSVVPAVSDPFTATQVTIHGRNFGSLLSRGYRAAIYGNISVFVTTPYTYTIRGMKYSSVRWEACVGGAQFVGDEQLLCNISPGAGTRDVKVEIMEQGINRTGTLLGAFVGVEMWLGGTAEDTHCQAFGAPWPHRQEAVENCGLRGFISSGPGPMHLPPKVDMARLNISSSIRAIVASKGRVFMGGSFAQVNSTRVNGIVAYDRQAVRTLALGVDGSVSSLQLVHRQRRLLVAGGSFTRVHQSSGSIITGGLALWDENSRQWGALGGVPLHGIALAVLVKGTEIFVGGRFTGAGDVSAASVAVYKASKGIASQGIRLDATGNVERSGIAGTGGGSWQAMGEGVKGMVYALAAGQATDVYVGGRFHLAGGVRVENVARWEGVEGTGSGGYWAGLVDSDCLRLHSGVCGVDGDVWALAFVGEYLYVGGQFASAGGKPARNVARFFSGVWEGVGKGVHGAVHVLTSIRIHGTLAGSCVYVAGEFTQVEDARGAMEVSGLARWCVGDPGTVLQVDESIGSGGGITEYWERVQVPEGVVSVRAIAAHD